MSRRIWRSVSYATRLSCSVSHTTGDADVAPPLTAQRRHASQHFFARDEVTSAEYADRRRRFLECVPPHSVVLLPAADEVSFSHDILFPHRQDSLWYHLFGLNTPLRRQLEPPPATLTDDVRATMAVLARFADSSTHTLLCVPGPTTDPETLVWASDTTSWATYAEACAPSVGGSSGTSSSSSAVIGNDVCATLDAVCSLIARMTAQKLSLETTMAAVADGAKAATHDVARDRRALLALVPQLFAAYPQQIRWDGRRYRLPDSPPGHLAGIHAQKEQKKPAATFRHPLEAFFSTLDATAFTVQLPRPLFGGSHGGAGEKGQLPWSSATFRYKTASGYTPGLVAAAPIETTVTAPAREICISAPTPKPSQLTPLSSRTTRGEVRLPIHRVDAHAWSYRRVKAPSQLRQHLRSARATEHAFAQLMACAATTATSEHELHCVFQRSVCDTAAHFGAAARVCSAYVPVIASGVHGTEIHYTENSATSSLGALVRVDAGVEVDRVPTDCTRTFPIGSHAFAPPPVAQLYDGLLRLQRALLRRIAPGVAVADVARLHLDETQALLCRLGVDMCGTKATSRPAEPQLAADAEEDRERRLPMSLVRSCFCAHAFGHLFGIDLHEEWGRVAAAAPRTFEGGMMHTVEPGIYIPDLERAKLFGIAAHQLPAAFHSGVGMQVEDDVLVLPSLEEALGDEAAAPTCPWSRGVYLQHALAAFARYYGGSITTTHSAPPAATSSASLLSPSVVVLWCYEHLHALHGSTSGVASATATPPLAAHEVNVVCFLFAQRVAMEGTAAAVAALAGDVAVAQRLAYTANPAYLGEEADAVPVPEAGNAAWYPYAVIVLTATVPKDRQRIAALMLPSGSTA